MASLRLTFPEKDEPTVIALTGARLTIGRLPFNTIQIIDRTVSGFHAELVNEHGHYRLHDRGSSNGTFVNGQKVSDFHLTEACTIAFGTVEVQFSPEEVAASEEVETFPTRSEINSVRMENADLKATVEALREEVNALRLARPMEGGEAALAVPKEEFDKVVVEREALKEERLKQDEEIARLKTDLAILKRDRVNLQLAYDGLQREITDVRAKAGGVEEIALPPKAAAAALAAQAPQPDKEIRVEVPVPANSQPAPEPVEPEASEPEPIPPVPTTPPFPNPPAVAPVPPRAPSLPGQAPRPFAPLPKAPAVAATVIARPVAVAPATPGIPVKAPGGLGSGIRPLAKAPGANPAVPGAVPTASGTPRVVARPSPSAKLPLQPTVKLAATPAPKIGPKGTQKIA